MGTYSDLFLVQDLLFLILGSTRCAGYILGVLTHTTAWDQLWGSDEILKLEVPFLLFIEVVNLALKLTNLQLLVKVHPPSQSLFSLFNI